MNDDKIWKVLSEVADGQPITVTTASGKNFSGVYNSEDSGYEEGLYFDTDNGQELHAAWGNLESVVYRSQRAVGASIMVPDGHPLAPPSNRKKPYTSRNG